ncbi:MAG: DUF421 domain-containing protein [Gemmatimonadota bacterium]|nr:DUF421 domain-containing protein [Gemmatimonadota bacterium]
MFGPHAFFDGWAGIARTMLFSVLAYAALIISLRLSGKRTLSKFNVFDFIFIVALGSTVATTILSNGIALTRGLVAVVSLILLQYAVSKITMVSETAERIINGVPTLLYHRGQFHWLVMRRERVTQEEILQAVRDRGVGTLQDIDAVVIETDGTFTVVRSGSDQKPASSLRDVPGTDSHANEGSPRGSD